MTTVPDTPENMRKCICGDCPSFPKEGGLYCAPEETKYRIRQRGCICGDCKVFKEYDLDGLYYCDQSAEQK